MPVLGDALLGSLRRPGRATWPCDFASCCASQCFFLPSNVPALLAPLRDPPSNFEGEPTWTTVPRLAPHCKKRKERDNEFQGPLAGTLGARQATHQPESRMENVARSEMSCDFC